MKKKISMLKDEEITFQEGYKEFIHNCKTRNLREATIKHYDGTISSIYKFISPTTAINKITKNTVDNFVLRCREELDIKDITIHTYLRGLKTILYFFMEKEWMQKFNIPLIKYDKEVIETYTNAELEVLLRKPNNKNCSFMEYKNWVIVNFLLAVGCRVHSLINIRIGDLDFDNNVVNLNTTKNRKPLIIPLSKSIIPILRDYIKIRNGDSSDYLFCTIYGEKISTITLSSNLRAYNRSRGINKTGIHRFRHTFAKDWILAGGDAFKLQKILGHSSLEVTRNYVEMFTEDLKNNFEEFNPLELLQKNKKSHITLKKD